MAKAPGKHHRKGMTLAAFFDRFPDDAAAERYLADARWPDGPRCPHDGCDSANVQIVKSRKPQPYRCRTCRKHFSVRTNTISRLLDLEALRVVLNTAVEHDL